MKEASALYRLLGDEARLRLLRVLDQDRFNVKELTGILGLAQSGVSRHLGLLKEAGLVVEERDGAFSYYRLVPGVREDRREPALAAAAGAVRRRRAARPLVKADEARLQEVLRLRRENFDARRPRHPRRPPARAGPQLGGVVARARACCCRRSTSPTSAAARATSRSKRRAGRGTSIAVDRSTGVLARAKALAARKQLTNITWKRGELEKLPLDDGSVDVALLSQALHHAPDPARALERGGARS